MEKRISEDDIERVLLGCQDAANDAGVVYRPGDFFWSFKGLDGDNVMSALRALESQGVIRMMLAGLPESYNIDRIEIDDGLAENYLASCETRRKTYWRNWRWNICAAVITAIAGAALGALFARVSLNLWP